MTSSDALRFVNSDPHQLLMSQPADAQSAYQDEWATKPIDLTIAIPTYNGSQRLPAVLDRLKAQVDTNSLAWEVIVADNNSKDDTAAIVRQYQQQWCQDNPLRYAFVGEQGAAFARQRAVEIARGSIVAFLDDDNVPEADWVTNVHGFALAHPEAGAFGSQIHGDFESPLPKELKSLSCFLAVIERGSQPRLYDPQKKMLPPGAGLAVRRSVWLKHVPKRLFLNHKGKKAGLASEDLEAVLHIQKAGWEIWYNPSMVVHHRIPSARLQGAYMRSLLRCVGLSRFYIRMLGIKDWQRPLMIPAYIANDMRRLALHYVKEGWNSNELSVASSCHREYLRSSAISPFFLVKEATQSKVSDYVEQIRFPQKTQYMERLSQTFEQQSFNLYSQPVVLVESDSHVPLQSELLVRLTPHTSSESSRKFWAFAEHNNLASTIDRWVITKVFHNLSGLQRQSRASEEQVVGSHYSINLSQNSVLDASLGSFIAGKLSQQGLAAQNICFEIQTGVALAHPEATSKLIQTLQEMGCAVTLDSFGTKRVSTEQIVKLPINFIKLDPNLLNSHRRYATYVNQIKAFLSSNQPNTTVIAKGIENVSLLAKAHDLGIRYAQGYQLSKPQIWSIETEFSESSD